MKINQKKTRKLIDNNHPILSLKELLDQILTEATNLPTDVKTSIVSARDSAWKTFVRDQEKSMECVKQDNPKPFFNKG